MDIQERKNSRPLIVCGKEVWSPETATSVNPADGTIAGTVCVASANDVKLYVEQAHHAWKGCGWRHLLPHDRARVLSRVADGLEARSEELAVLQMRDCGKPLYECHKMVASAAGSFRYYSAVLESEETEVTSPRGEYVSMTVNEPYGLVGLITPWNSPMMEEGLKLAVSLAAGNGVVLKPSEETPLLALEVAQICIKAGVPGELITVLNGPGSVTGDAIVKHPRIRLISFTGGTETGRKIGSVCADRIIPTVFELGGKSPHIVFEDADLDLAIDAVTAGIFGSAGQSCVAGSRLMVQRSIADDFVARLAEIADNIVVGLPDNPQTQMGPLISLAHREKVESYIQVAVKEDGGQVLTGGTRPTDVNLDKGAFLKPTIISGVRNTARIAQEEIFGPVVTAMTFESETDVVAMANDTVFGLAAGIWTKDFKRAWRVGRAIEAGSVWVNCYKQSSVSSPFGGFKNSGLQREKGRQALRVYGQTKSIYLGLHEEPSGWGVFHGTNMPD